MRHRVKGKKLGRAADQRRALLRSLVSSLFEHDKIQTTLVKAKEARKVADRLITLARRGDLHARRQALRFVTDRAVVDRLFLEVAPRYADRQGGYTRVIPTGPRRGDAAPMAVLELSD